MQKGFTLIELLVVISIIVVLASIVLVGVQNATQKAADARIISAVAQYRSQAEIYRSEVGSYAGLPTASTTYSDINRVLVDIAGQGATTTILADSSNYCIKVSLKAGAGRFYCADALGNATTTVNANLCSGSTIKCE